jgi:Ca-activated chloride channel homolog
MLRINRIWISALTMAAFAFVVLAQEAVFRTDTRLVVLHATVVDKKGNLLTDLPRSAFTVIEDRQEQTIKDFKREDIPVSMGLIIDNSGSMRDKRKRVEAAALNLVKASNPNDEVFIVNFNDEFFLDAPMTNDIRKLEEGLTRIDSRGGTAMRDALSLSIDHLVEEGKKDKKILLVVTDGNDNTSEVTLEKLVQKAQRSEVLIYAIGILGEDESRRDRKRAERALEALTEATGGAVYFPKEVDEVQEIALQVAHDIRNQYVITYTPTNLAMDGTFRRIEVKVKGPGSPKVRTRTGYYAAPDTMDLSRRGSDD